MEIDSTAAMLLPLLRQFVRGDYGIALGGAHAKGAADAQSDLDLYIFAHEVLPKAERAALVHQFSAAIHTLTQWGDDSKFIQQGTDFYYDVLKVECWLRNVTPIENIIAECQAGIVRQELVTWTVMGFYNHCTLNDLHKMQILDDPAGIITRWKDAVSVYPPALKRTILTQHIQAAKFWRGNFHYETAVQRGDVLYVMGIVQQVIHNLIQVLFALNETYFGGDKKITAQLAHLTIRPEQFEERITALMTPEMSAPDVLLHQRDKLYRLVDEVETLIGTA